MEKEDDKKHPEGHYVGMWIGIGMAMFAGLGVPLSIALESPGLIGIGPAIGVGFGAVIGQAIEAKKKKEGKTRPLTDEECKSRKKLAIAGSAILVVGLLLLLGLLFLK